MFVNRHAAGRFRRPGLDSVVAVSLVLLLIRFQVVQSAVAYLPPEFKYEPGAAGAGGVELVWTPPQDPGSRVTEASGDEDKKPASDPVIRIGGSRPEFRFDDGTILGYPRERRSKSASSALVLALQLTKQIQEKISELGGENLQVWSSGRRLDMGGYVASTAANVTGSGVSGAFVLGTLPKASTVPIHPAAKGKYNISRLAYDLPSLPHSGFQFPLEVVAEVTYPLSSSTRAPLVLFMHGRYLTCYQDGYSDFSWPCPTDLLPIPSHKGFRYVADALASQGYAVVSVASNSISAQDFIALDGGALARSSLIGHHLALWATWSSAGGDPWGGLFRGKVDMSKVVLVGHSRGGEGIHRAAIEAKVSDPYKIVGLVSYGPTAFGRQVTPDIPSATILSTCDGDVIDLQGQTYVDTSRDVAYSTALRTAVIVLGANHNYFNTEWTPGLAVSAAYDDWQDDYDPVCGVKAGTYRITAQEQQKAGAAYTAALVRLAAKQDAAMLPLLDGSFVRPRVLGRVDVATQAVGGAGYRLLYVPKIRGAPILERGMKGVVCQGNQPYAFGTLPECNDDSFNAPHFLERYEEYSPPGPRALLLEWARRGATARFAVAPGARDFRSLDYINIRVANNPASGNGAMLGIRIGDSYGRTATLTPSLTSIEGWPGTGILNRLHGRTLQVGLAEARSTAIDLKTITEINLVSTGESGKVWVLDIAASERRAEVPAALRLPVLSVGVVQELEGAGFTSAVVSITSNRRLRNPGSIWIRNGGSGYRMNLAVNSSGTVAQVNVSWVGDSVHNDDQGYGFYLYPTRVRIDALSGLVTGRYEGGVKVQEDDPKGTVTAVASSVTVSAGTPLTWTFQLSQPHGMFFSFFCTTIPPTGYPELLNRDVPSAWLAENGGFYTTNDPVPLSSFGLTITVSFTYGSLSATLSVPTVADGYSDVDAAVAFSCTDMFGYMEELVLTGIVQENRRRLL